jgi:hypothetical protein
MTKLQGNGGILRRTAFLAAIWGSLGLSGCSGPGTADGTPGAAGSGATGGSGGTQVPPPGTAVAVTSSPAASAEHARLTATLGALEGLNAADFVGRFSVSAAAPPHYDRATIAGLDKIQASSLALNEPELAALDAQGFAITDRKYFPSFTYGYQTLYLEDLPLYVSADSILDALHVSYDSILKTLEERQLSGELSALLTGMHARLRAGSGQELGSDVVHDADLFIAVARSLLAGSEVGPVAGGSAQDVRDLVTLAKAGAGVKTFQLFGVLRKDEDFSQFKPRGHYTDSIELTRYFKAMMWLGRIDLRLLETESDGSQVFRRQQLEVMLLLRELIDTELRKHFDRVDRTVAAFVGEPDYMVLSEVDSLVADLGIASLSDLAGISDDALAQAIIDGGYGAQRISSHIMINGAEDTLPLSRSFALLGQRYVIDSHVFSNVVYDRVGGRMLPDPLDVAFAALGNNRAGALLAPQLAKYDAGGYPSALAKMRLLVDEHPAEFWDASLYTLWLSALRGLSPTEGADASAGLFPVARTEAWQRRMLNGQLASWAQLRHDTILYAKQSYTGGASCDFPDAYVDPYPQFYARVAAYGTRGLALLEELKLPDAAFNERLRAHFSLVTDVAKRLQGMAEHERTGAEFTPEMLAFINEAVVVQNVCGGGTFESGWYKKLFFDPHTALDPDPTIADVHTQPTDEAGNFVGHVLHVGTGLPRVMVVVAEGCSGPRAYAGLASSYREKVTKDFERLDDPTWASQLQGEPEVPWMQDLVAQ